MVVLFDLCDLANNLFSLEFSKHPLHHVICLQRSHLYLFTVHEHWLLLCISFWVFVDRLCQLLSFISSQQQWLQILDSFISSPSCSDSFYNLSDQSDYCIKLRCHPLRWIPPVKERIFIVFLSKSEAYFWLLSDLTWVIMNENYDDSDYHTVTV